MVPSPQYLAPIATPAMAARDEEAAILKAEVMLVRLADGLLRAHRARLAAMAETAVGPDDVGSGT